MLSIAMILVAGLVLCWPADAHQVTTPAGVTVDYGGLSSPATGTSCCNKMDCAPAEVTFDSGKGLLIRRLDGYPMGRPVVPGRRQGDPAVRARRRVAHVQAAAGPRAAVHHSPA
jgi:hypothetical protein